MILALENDNLVHGRKISFRCSGSVSSVYLIIIRHMYARIFGKMFFIDCTVEIVLSVFCHYVVYNVEGQALFTIEFAA